LGFEVESLDLPGVVFEFGVQGSGFGYQGRFAFVLYPSPIVCVCVCVCECVCVFCVCVWDICVERDRECGCHVLEPGAQKIGCLSRRPPVLACVSGERESERARERERERERDCAR
jgi:hypothetical protein